MNRNAHMWHIEFLIELHLPLGASESSLPFTRDTSLLDLSPISFTYPARRFRKDTALSSRTIS